MGYINYMNFLINDQFKIYNEHIQIICQLTQTIRKYDSIIQLLSETDENNTEINFLKDIRDSINKQIGEHEGLCFVISKLVTIK